MVKWMKIKVREARRDEWAVSHDNDRGTGKGRRPDVKAGRGAGSVVRIRGNSPTVQPEIRPSANRPSSAGEISADRISVRYPVRTPNRRTMQRQQRISLVSGPGPVRPSSGLSTPMRFCVFLPKKEMWLSNACSEATNNKIKLIIRTAFGFRNVDNLVYGYALMF